VATLAGAINGLETLLATLSGSGLRRVHGDPPESLSEFPAAVLYPFEGTLEQDSHGFGREFHVIVLDIYLSRTSIAQASAAVQTWITAISTLLRTNPKLGSTADAVVWPVEYKVGPMPYAQQLLFGVRFRIRVKVVA